MKTAAIIPVFNNDQTIGVVVKETRKYVDTVIVVDDGSTDDTSSTLKRLAKRSHCIVLTHQKNRGKGEALRTAIRHLRSRRGKGKPEAVVFLDADWEHEPNKIPQFIDALRKADFIIGERTSHRSRARQLLNKWMTFWFMLIDSGITDPSCGFRAVRWEVLRKLELCSPDFCIDAEMILEVIKAGASITSIGLPFWKHAPSSVNRKDFIRINNFFDKWVLHNAKHLRLSDPRRVTLITGASVGKAIGSLLAKWMK